LITEIPTTIYLADDHELVATGIASIICNCLPKAKVTTFKNGQLLYQKAEKEVPDLVFLDYEMPVWDGKTTLIELKKKHPELPILMLSMLNEKAIIQSCITHGAIGFLNKDCSLDEFKMAIENAFSGTVFYSREVLKSLSGTASNSVNNHSHIEELTERELDVLRLLCEGMSPKEIGEKLFLSPRTVEKHKDNIMQKMEVSSVAKLISVALKNKLI
jgi:two-component system response regulator NreC